MADQKTVDKVKELLQGHCWEPLEEAANEWLAAIGTDKEEHALKKLIPMLKQGVATADEIVEKFGADEAREEFGDMADKLYEYGKALQDAGKKYCDCPSCTLVKNILADLGEKLD